MSTTLLSFKDLTLTASLGLRWGQRPDATPEEGVLARKVARRLVPVLQASDLYVLIGSIESSTSEPWQEFKRELLAKVTPPAEVEDGEEGTGDSAGDGTNRGE